MKTFKKGQLVKVINIQEVNDLKENSVTVRRNITAAPGIIRNQKLNNSDFVDVIGKSIIFEGETHIFAIKRTNLIEI